MIALRSSFDFAKRICYSFLEYASCQHLQFALKALAKSVRICYNRNIRDNTDTIYPLILATSWQHYGNKKPDSQDFFVKYIYSICVMKIDTTYIGCILPAKIEWE